MKVNRVISVNYSNINNANKGNMISTDRSRVLASPGFGNIETLTQQAVNDQFVANVNNERQDQRNMARNNPIVALGGKFGDLFAIFTPKRHEAEQMKAVLNEAMANPSSSIAFKY